VVVSRGRCPGLAPAAVDGGLGRGLAAPQGDDLVAVVPGDDASTVADGLARRLGPEASTITLGAARRGTDLAGTLSAWFAAGGSHRHAAEALHVHVNTVVQRLERVGSLLGAGWGEPERALEVQLALRLHRLRGGG
jgi:DNA-binding PucR family transcriptional regulator